MSGLADVFAAAASAERDGERLRLVLGTIASTSPLTVTVDGVDTPARRLHVVEGATQWQPAVGEIAAVLVPGRAGHLILGRID